MKNITQKQVIRAAIKIHDNLPSVEPMVLSNHRIEGDYIALAKHFQRYQVAIDRGWYAAARELRRKIDFCSGYLEQSASHLRRGAQTETPKRQTTLRDIYLDLIMLTVEFEDVRILPLLVEVTTEPITLEGINLGRFRITLNTEKENFRYSIKALEPFRSHNGYSHPHISGGELCEGEGEKLVSDATAAGEILNLFEIILATLVTFNPESAYCTLEDWQGGNSCESCGANYDPDGEGFHCDGCGRGHCDSCGQGCEGTECGRIFCAGCESFDGINDYLCHSCDLEAEAEKAEAEAEKAEAEAEAEIFNIT